MLMSLKVRPAGQNTPKFLHNFTSVLLRIIEEYLYHLYLTKIIQIRQCKKNHVPCKKEKDMKENLLISYSNKQIRNKDFFGFDCPLDKL